MKDAKQDDHPNPVIVRALEERIKAELSGEDTVSCMIASLSFAVFCALSSTGSHAEFSTLLGQMLEETRTLALSEENRSCIEEIQAFQASGRGLS